MRPIQTASKTLAIALAISCMCAAPRADAQWIVNDPLNTIQGTLTAMQTLQSNINEVRQIANQIQQYQNMLKNTSSLPLSQWQSARDSLSRLSSAVQQGRAISYSMQNLDAAFRSRYPGYQTPGRNTQQLYSDWNTTTLDSIRGSMNAANISNANMANETTMLDSLQQQAASATGQKAALDAGNRIALVQIQQQQELRSMMYAQMQAQNAYMAGAAQKDGAAEATARSVTVYKNPRDSLVTKPVTINAPTK